MFSNLKTQNPDAPDTHAERARAAEPPMDATTAPAPREFAEKVRAAGLRRIDQAVRIAREQEQQGGRETSIARARALHGEGEVDERRARGRGGGAATTAMKKPEYAALANRSSRSGGSASEGDPVLEYNEKAKTSSENLADRARKYLERRQAREAQRRLDEERKATEGLQPKPVINKNSDRLAQNRGREGDVGLALYADAEVKRVSREILAEEHYEGTMLARPAITRQAAELVRDGDIADRLYQQARVKQQQQQRDGTPETAKGVSPAPRRASFSLKGSADAKSPSRRMSSPAHLTEATAQAAATAHARPRARRASEMSHATHAIKHAESLYERALEAKQARERSIQLENEKLRKQAKPRLGTKTKQIAADLGQSSMDRLLNQDKDVLSRRQARRAMALEEERPSFKPQINPNSKRLARDQHSESANAANESAAADSAANGATASATHTRLYEEYTSRQARRSTLESRARREKAQIEVQECTFKPHITHFVTVEEERKSNRQDVVDRLKEWQERREQRLAYQRKQQDDQGLSEEYTFAPKINAAKPAQQTAAVPAVPAAAPAAVPRPGPAAGPAVAAVPVDLKKKPGVDAYIERQRRAREERERKERAQKSHGTSKWTNRVTIPVGPKLGVAHRRKLPAGQSAHPETKAEVHDEEYASAAAVNSSLISALGTTSDRRPGVAGKKKSPASQGPKPRGPHTASNTAVSSSSPDMGVPRRAPPPRPPSLSPMSPPGEFEVPAAVGIRDPELVLRQAKEQFALASKLVQAHKAQEALPKAGPREQLSTFVENSKLLVSDQGASGGKLAERELSPSQLEARLLGFDDAAPLEEFRVLKSLLENSS